MKRFFVDANVLLDAIFERGDQAQDAIQLLSLGGRRKTRLVTTSISVGVVIYMLQKRANAKKPGPILDAARQTVRELLNCIEIAPVLAEHVMQSVASSFYDIEDGAQYFAATASGPIDGVISGDRDFVGKVADTILTAEEALKLIGK